MDSGVRGNERRFLTGSFEEHDAYGRSRRNSACGPVYSMNDLGQVAPAAASSKRCLAAALSPWQELPFANIELHLAGRI
jgi:hypothetical protein